MIEAICNVVVSYTSEDFENWMVGIGTIGIALGTIGIAYGAMKAIPAKIAQRHKDPDLVALYQKVVYRLYREVEGSSEGISFRLPGDLEMLTKLLTEKYPQVGSKEDADRIMDDLMLDGYFQTVKAGTTVIETAKWNPKNRSKPVKQEYKDLEDDE